MLTENEVQCCLRKWMRGSRAMPTRIEQLTRIYTYTMRIVLSARRNKKQGSVTSIQKHPLFRLAQRRGLYFILGLRYAAPGVCTEKGKRSEARVAATSIKQMRLDASTPSLHQTFGRKLGGRATDRAQRRGQLFDRHWAERPLKQTSDTAATLLFRAPRLRDVRTA